MEFFHLWNQHHSQRVIEVTISCSQNLKIVGSSQHRTSQESVLVPSSLAAPEQDRARHRHRQLLHVHLRQPVPVPHHHSLHLRPPQPDIRGLRSEGHWTGSDC